MGTKIIETGSTAGGIAKVEYKDEAGNVLWYYDDAGNFVRNGNAKVTGLAGTGNRMIVADATGNLKASPMDVNSTGTVNIPAEQNYNINGVALKDVAETLTNKTLTSPIINGTVTGTAVTTTATANAIVKRDNNGQISSTGIISKDTYFSGNVEGKTAVWLESTSPSGGVTSVKKSQLNTSPYIYDLLITNTKNYYVGLVGNYIWKIANATDSIDLFSINLANGDISGVGIDTSATANKLVKRDANGAITSSQYKLSALNTAPASPTATGTTGEIRIDANYIYICVATNTWKRVALSTW